jgi:DNA-binding transcriptional LysR family regulator
MNLEQLRSFLMVAETGHFTNAAAELHVAQPTLSRHIATLEDELGLELFNRARGNVTLTAAGETLLPIASRMIADAEHIHFQMQELSGLRRGRVRLGAPPSMCVSVVAEVIGPYNQYYPGVDLHLRESGSHQLLNELVGGTLDLALVVASEHDPSSAESLEHIPLLFEELVVISANEQQFDGYGEELTLGQLAKLPQIVFSDSYDLRAATMDAYRQHELSPNVVIEGAEMDAVLRFVERGIGVAVVPATVLLDRPGLASRRLTQPSLTRTIALAHRKDINLSSAAEAMQALIIATVEDVAEQSPAIRSLT